MDGRGGDARGSDGPVSYPFFSGDMDGNGISEAIIQKYVLENILYI